MLGALLGAAGSIASGILGNKAADKQADLQKKFAQKGIRWKVADSLAAGIHPLYGLGANTISYQPMQVGGDYGIGGALAEMGQGIDRAQAAAGPAGMRAASARLEALTLERAGLENDLLRSQIRRTNAPHVGPPMPGASEINVPLGEGTIPFPLDKGDPAQKVQDELGDLMENIYGGWRTANSSAVNFARWYKRQAYDYSTRKPPRNAGYPRGGGVR